MNIVGNLAFYYFPVWRLDKSEFIYLRKGCQRSDKPNVGTFRRLNRTYPAIVSRMNVTDLKTGPFPCKTTGSQGGESSFVGNFTQRVCLVHKLRKLAA